VVHEEGPQRLVASVHGLGGLLEERQAQGIVHGAISGLSPHFQAGRVVFDMPDGQLLGKEDEEQMGRNTGK
jgi:hypothetical protein